MNLNRDNIRIFFCFAIFLGFLFCVITNSQSLSYWYIFLTLLLIVEILWSEILFPLIREKIVNFLGILFLLIVLYFFVINVVDYGDNPQMWRLTFLSLLTLGLFYENQKSVFAKNIKIPVFGYAGISLIFVAFLGLLFTAAVAIFLKKSTSFEITSMFISAFLAFGIFYATRAFNQTS